jgi:hypothetical protein
VAAKENAAFAPMRPPRRAITAKRKSEENENCSARLLGGIIFAVSNQPEKQGTEES